MNVSIESIAVEFDELLEKLSKHWTWDWAFFSMNTINFKNKKKTVARLSLMYGGALSLNSKVEVVFPTDFFWNVFSTMVKLHEDFGYTIIKGREVENGFDIRVYRDEYKIPRHIIARGVEYPWEGV